MSFINEESHLVNIQNSAGWVVSIANTVAGGDIVSVANSAGWIIAQSNTAGMTVNVINSAGWTVNVANSAGGSVNIINSAGWVVAQSNTAEQTFFLLNSSAVAITNTSLSTVIQNSAGWTVGVGSTSIVNSAGWVVAQSNTDGMTVLIRNSAGWVVNIANSAGWVANVSSTILNSAGWNVAVSNTGNIGLIGGYDTSKVYDGGAAVILKYATINVLNTSNTVIVNAVSDKRIRVMSVMLISRSTNNATIQSGSSSAVSLHGAAYLAANVGFVLSFHPNGWFQTATSTLLNINTTAADSIGGCITYLETS